MRAKAEDTDFAGRFREIISDPLNLLIRRHPLAGAIDGGYVVLHNGHRVPLVGPHAYYGNFSHILVVNRGVHEPLEEYVFQELIPHLPPAPTMLELGAYWGHYSMWLKEERPGASVHLVEPEEVNLEAGRRNFALNGYQGEFVRAFVGTGNFEVAQYLDRRNIDRLDVLHSDIQGYEVEMISGCRDLLARKVIDYVFVSTHSQELHAEVVQRLTGAGYRIEVSSDFEHETTAHDGLVFASSPRVSEVLPGFRPPSRVRIDEAEPAELVQVLVDALRARADSKAAPPRGALPNVR